MKTIVIYHKSDFDGIFCREIAKKFLPSGTELIGWEYGDPVPAVSPEDRIFILDLSVPELMDNPNLVWIDHHKSAIDKYPTSIRGVRIDGVAACRLTWQWFTNERGLGAQSEGLPFTKQDYVDRIVKEPLAVRLAGEYDVWDKRDENAELFQHGLRSQPLADHVWENLFGNDLSFGRRWVNLLLSQGKCIKYAKTQENEFIILRSGFDAEFEGLNFLCCNHAMFNSHLFTAGIKDHHDALCGFRFDGEKFSVSLYHAPGKEHHDLSKIAVKYGGGGHRGACGFTSYSLPFTKKF